MLQALPDDIRSNIEEALQAKLHHKENEREDEPGLRHAVDLCFVDDERPGCSHWTCDDAADSAASASHDCPMSLPSYSQVSFESRWTFDQTGLTRQSVLNIMNRT